jgi:hypothetical protein
MFWLLNACNGIKKIIKSNRKNPNSFWSHHNKEFAYL